MSEEEKEIIVRCEKKKDEFGVEKYLCRYDGGEFEVEVGERREEVELSIPKDVLREYDIKEVVKMMLEPAKRED